MERKRINMLLCEFKDIHTSYISNINMSKISSHAISIFDIQMMVKSSAIDFFSNPKGQLISKCPCEKIVSTKIPTKKFDRFCPASFIQTRYVNYALTWVELPSDLGLQSKYYWILCVFSFSRKNQTCGQNCFQFWKKPKLNMKSRK